jgi:hypothetical protein
MIDRRTVLAALAAAGLVAGLSACEEKKSGQGDANTAKAKGSSEAGSDKDCCAGKNDCKGKGGCTSKEHGHACAGKNACKGQGGCKHRDCG